MSSRMMLIAPPEVLNTIPNRANHLLLPDLLGGTKLNTSYAKYYMASPSDERNVVILDNGAFEGMIYSPDELNTMAEAVGATHIVMPDDVTGSDPDPFDTFLRWRDRWPSTKVEGRIYIAQGRTPTIVARNFLAAIEYLNEHKDESFNIGVSSMSLRFLRNDDPEWVRPRAMSSIITALFNHPAGDELLLPTWIHLFGAVSFKEMERCLEVSVSVFPNITFDTCDPIKEATAWSTRNPYGLVEDFGAKMERIKGRVSVWDKL